MSIKQETLYSMVYRDLERAIRSGGLSRAALSQNELATFTRLVQQPLGGPLVSWKRVV